MKKIKITIQGMTCSHCEMRVSNAIKSIQGVMLDKLELGEAIVTIENEIQQHEVVAAIKSVGYLVTDVKD